MKSSDAMRLLTIAGMLVLSPIVGRCNESTPPDTLAEARTRGVIEIAVYADFPPYSYGTATTNAKGIDVDIARAIAQRLGLKLKLRMISAGESVTDDLRNHVWKGHYLGGGVADLMLHVGYDSAFADREKNVIFFEPYFHDVVAVAYLPNRIKNIDSPLALAEHRIAVEGDTIGDHIMGSAYGGAWRNSAVRTRSLADAVAAFEAGEVDGVMGPQSELQGLLAEQRMVGVSFHVQEQVGQLRTSWDFGVAVKNSDSASLRDAVSNVLETLKENGSMKQMFANYGVKYLDAASPAAGNTLARETQ